MDRDTIVIYGYIADRVAEWGVQRIGRFFKLLHEAKKNDTDVVHSGDDAIDMAISSILGSSVRRKRGGQVGNKNACKQTNTETNKNESETNKCNIYNNKENYIYNENENAHTHMRGDELLPFPNWMTTEEKRMQLWRDVVDNKGDYPKDMLEEFAKYYGMPSAKNLGRLVCEECTGWDTKTMLERWNAKRTQQ